MHIALYNDRHCAPWGTPLEKKLALPRTAFILNPMFWLEENFLQHEAFIRGNKFLVCVRVDACYPSRYISFIVFFLNLVIGCIVENKTPKQKQAEKFFSDESLSLHKCIPSFSATNVPQRHFAVRSQDQKSQWTTMQFHNSQMTWSLLTNPLMWKRLTIFDVRRVRVGAPQIPEYSVSINNKFPRWCILPWNCDYPRYLSQASRYDAHRDQKAP